MIKIFQNPKLNERIDCIILNIIEAFSPDKIILFGSYARDKDDVIDDITEIDLLVIAKSNLRFTDRIKKARKACKGEPPINPLVYTPHEVNSLLEDGEGFLEEVMDEGIIIYQKEENSGA